MSELEKTAERKTAIQVEKKKGLRQTSDIDKGRDTDE
jgi:hypothetical protein